MVEQPGGDFGAREKVWQKKIHSNPCSAVTVRRNCFVTVQVGVGHSKRYFWKPSNVTVVQKKSPLYADSLLNDQSNDEVAIPLTYYWVSLLRLDGTTIF